MPRHWRVAYVPGRVRALVQRGQGRELNSPATGDITGPIPPLTDAERKRAGVREAALATGQVAQRIWDNVSVDNGVDGNVVVAVVTGRRLRMKRRWRHQQHAAIECAAAEEPRHLGHVGLNDAAWGSSTTTHERPAGAAGREHQDVVEVANGGVRLSGGHVGVYGVVGAVAAVTGPSIYSK